MMSQVFGVIDCARDPRLFDWIRATPEHTCLLQGTLSPELERVSPHLVRLEPDLPFIELWRTEGRGKAWGIVCKSDLDIVRLRKHLKKFLTARLPGGQPVVFRFYDPRVWRTYWPSLSQDERNRWLSGADSFTTEPV